MKYEFGLRGHDIGNTLDEMCENAKKYGVKNLQFAMAKTCNNINFDEIGFDEKVANEIKAKLDEYGLHVSVLGCYIDPINPNDEVRNTQLTRFKNFISYAKVFGADMIATETGFLGTQEETRSEETYQFLLNNLRPLAKEAEDKGVMMAIEMVWIHPMYCPQRMKRLLEDLNSPNVCVIVDMSNLTYPETRNNQCDTMNDCFDLLGDNIRGIHLKDFTFDDENKKSFALAGSGELMTELFFDRMKGLKKMPEIILDETKVTDYAATLEILEDVLTEE